MKGVHPKWNFKEFSAFLLIYAAYADNVFSPEEETMILSKVNQETLKGIEEEFQSMNDKDVIETILAYKGLYFPTNERKKELLAMVKKEFFVDGEFSQIEESLLIALRRIM